MVPLLVSAALGALGGAAAGLFTALVLQPRVTGKPPTLRGTLTTMGSFALGGAIGGLTFGFASPLVAGAAARIVLGMATGAFGFAVGSTVNRMGSNLAAGQPLMDGTGRAALIGVVAGIVCGFLVVTTEVPVVPSLLGSLYAQDAAFFIDPPAKRAPPPAPAPERDPPPAHDRGQPELPPSPTPSKGFTDALGAAF